MMKVAVGEVGLVFRSTLVVWPGVITTTSVLNGLTYKASASTIVTEWLAILKYSSSFIAAFIRRSMYVLPGFTFNLNVSGKQTCQKWILISNKSYVF